MLGYGPISSDPISGLFGLTTGSPPPAVPQISTIGAKAFRRRTTQYVVKLPELAESNPLVASTGRTIYEQFKTRTMRGRKLAKPGWISAMVPTGSAPVAQPLAHNRPVTLRRRSTKRRLLDVPDFLSNYIAPTVAAIEMDQKATRIRYVRKFVPAQPQILYPQTPSTGPPQDAWAAVSAERVSQRRRFVPSAKQSLYPATPVQISFVDAPEVIRRRATDFRYRALPSVPVYPATSATPSADRAVTESFRTKVGKGRRLQAPPAVSVYPAIVVQVPFVDAPEVIRRRSLDRKIKTVIDAPVRPLAPSVSLFVDAPDTIKRRVAKRKLKVVQPVPVYPYVAAAPVNYLVPVKANKRKADARGFVWSATTLGIPSGGTSSAPISAAEFPDTVRRSETARKLRKPAAVPVYPVTSAGPAVPFGAISTKRIRGRKSRGLGFVSVDAIVGEPVGGTTPALYPSVEDYGYRRRRETKHKLKVLPVVPVYPFSAPSASADRAISEPFKTRVSKGRKSQKLAFIPVFPATAPTPANFAALTQPKILKRRITARKLRDVVDAPVFPATPAAPVVFGAVVKPKVNRRKSRSPGFVLDYALVGAPQVPGYDATEAYGYIRRSETDKVLRKLPIVPVYPATPAAPVTVDALTLHGLLRRQKTEYRLRSAVLANVFPQTPAPAIVIGSVVQQGYLQRRDTTKKLKTAVWPNVFPQTPPVPEQPYEAFRTVRAKYATPMVRTVLAVYAPQNIDAAPYVPPVDPGTGGGGGGGAGWKKHHEHKRRKDRELEDTIRQIYRELTREPATVDLAVQIVAPITVPEARAVPTVQQVEFERATAEIETALRLVHQQIEDFRQAEEKDRQELFEIIEIMHMSGLI